MIWKRIVASALAVCLTFGAIPLTKQYHANNTSIVYAAEAQSGTCGESVTWEYDGNGTLTISGIGEVTSTSSWSTLSSNVTEIVIGEGVTSLGSQVFYKFTSLKKISMPNTLEVIGSHALSFCSNLVKADIPASVTSISEYAFSHCSGISAFHVDENNKSYTTDQQGAIYSYDMTKLVMCPRGYTGTFMIPEGVTIIGQESFSYINGLKKVIIPDSVATISRHSFGNCALLSEVDIPKNTTYIDSRAFEGCESLTAINVDSNNEKYASSNGILYTKDFTKILTCPNGYTGTYKVLDGTTTIASDAFISCSKLTNVEIPDTVNYIGSWAFLWCSSLKSIIIPDGVRNIYLSTFSGCEKLETVSLPDTLIELDDYAFNNCSSLTSIKLPDSLTTLDYHAFDGCASLREVIIPKNTTKIGYYAFEDAGLLKLIVLNASCEIADHKGTIPEGATIYGYPNSTVQAYAEKYGRNFIELDENGNIPTPNPLTNEYNGPTLEDIKAIQAFCLNADYVGNGKVIDVNEDGRVDVFDLCIAKQRYIENRSNLEVTGTLVNFNADETSLITNYDETVVFTVEKYDKQSDVYLYIDNSCIGKMHDDGQNGDEAANDNIYAFEYSFNETNAGAVEAYALSNAIKSNTISITFFDIPSSSDYETLSSTSKQMDAICSKFEDANGYVPSNKLSAVLEALNQYATELYKNSEVIYYEQNDDNILIQLKSGLHLIYGPRQEGYDSNDPASINEIVTFQPCIHTYSANDFKSENDPISVGEANKNNYMALVDDAASEIVNEFSDYSFKSSSNLDDDNVSLDQIKSMMTSSGIILWHGHGWYSQKYGTSLQTGVDYDYSGGWTYSWDVIHGRILCTNDNQAMISPKYIEKYCKNKMKGSFVYLAACSSLRDNKLANAFYIHGGSSCVIGSSKDINTCYNLTMMNAVVTKMTEINPKTCNYYTAKQAVEYAKNKYGANDSINYSGDGAYIKPYGNTAFRFNEVTSGKITGKVCKASDRATPLRASVIAYKGNTKVTYTTCDSNGNYSLNVPEGSYNIRIYLQGYIEFDNYVEIAPDETTYLETFLLVENSEETDGTASGQITNALTGAGLGDVNLSIRNGWNNKNVGAIIKTITTDSNGKYSVSLPLGNYTLYAEKDGFISGVINIVVNPGTTDSQNGSISPNVDGNDFRIVLTWGKNPNDLDSHLNGAYFSDSRFEVYYSDKTKSEDGITICNLDVDDTDSYGPETTTLHVVSALPYYFFVHKYDGSGSLATSEAQVKVYQGETLLATYNVPTDKGTSDYWNVFAIINGKIITKNTITSSPDTNYLK